MRRSRLIESYGPSIAAGEAIAKAGRPDLAYGCWANAATAGHGLQSLEIHLLAEESFVLSSAGMLVQARAAAQAEQALAEQLAQPELLAMASHDRGVIALHEGEHELAATLLADSLVEGAPISRPLTRLALAEALTRSGRPERAGEEIRATVLEPVRPSDFPEALVPKARTRAGTDRARKRAGRRGPAATGGVDRRLGAHARARRAR
jgi:hypothetical protein